MKRYGPRWLIRLAVIAVITPATCAGAETSRLTTPRPGPSYRRIVYTPPTPRRAPPLPAYHMAYAREIAEAANRYAVPERLIWAVIRVESGFDHRAVSRKGARGVMQLMPETAAILGVRDPFDPRQNIHAGTRHLRGLMVRFRYDVRLAVAAYNAGEKPVAHYGDVPPYPETRAYVTQVLRFYVTPIEQVELRGNGVRRIVEPNGTIIYTNIPFGSALSR